MLKNIKPTWRTKLSTNLYLLRLISLGCLTIALSQPQLSLHESKIYREGIGIVLAIDVSSSMLAEDFMVDGRRVNRLEAVKEVAKEFIKARKNDSLSLVCFAAYAYVVCPLTLDHEWLLENLKRIQCGMVEDGTAIGLGIACALNRLKNTKFKSKVVILLTDGRNNAGDLSPSLAADMAKSLGIKVYTIGAGSKGTIPYPVRDLFGRIIYKPIKLDLDEETLKIIAQKTGGKYFRATNTSALRKIYSEIDKMEKIPIEEKWYYKEYQQLFPLFIIIGTIFLILEIILRKTVLSQIP